MAYFQDIREGIKTTLKGLSLTLRHLGQATRRRQPLGIEGNKYFEQATGLVTVEYPHETVPIPDNGRYRLHNEIDDCIVCDKCAKICPVDCITIDPIKATEEVGRASDGSPIRLYAAQFDIDMAKCCYCGLCTVVCPTECLTMEKTFDYSTYELAGLNYAFANLTPEQADEKRALYEQYVREKEAAKAVKPVAPSAEPTAKPAARPAFRPGMKPATKPVVEEPTEPVTPTPADAEVAPAVETPIKPRPVFRPGMKPAAKPTADESTPAPADVPPTEPTTESSTETPAKPRPVFRPGMKPKPITEPVAKSTNVPAAPALEADLPATPKPKPAFRPTMKPTAAKPAPADVAPNPDATPAEAEAIAMQGVAEQPGVTEPIEPTDGLAVEPAMPAKPRPAFRPTMKPAGSKSVSITDPVISVPTETPQPAANNPESAAEADLPVTPKPKPAFRPTMKPKPQAEPAGELVVEAPTSTPEVTTNTTTEAPPSADTTKPEADDTPSELPTPKPKPAFRPTMKPKQT